MSLSSTIPLEQYSTQYNESRERKHLLLTGDEATQPIASCVLYLDAPRALPAVTGFHSPLDPVRVVQATFPNLPSRLSNPVLTAKRILLFHYEW